MFVTGDSTVKVWEESVQTPIHVFDFPFKKINDIKFTNDSRRILAGGDSGNIYVSNLYKEESNIVQVKHSRSINTICCSPNGEMFSCGNNSGLISVFDFKTLKEVYFHAAHKSSISSVLFSPDSDHILGGDSNGKISIVNIKNGKPRLLSGWSSKYGPINHLTLSLTSKLMGISSGDTVRLYDFNAEKVFSPIQTTKVNKICFSPTTTKLMIVGTESGDIKFIDTTSLEIINVQNFKNSVTGLDMNYDGYTLGVSLKTPDLFTVDCRNMNKIFHFKTKEVVNSFVFQPTNVFQIPFFKHDEDDFEYLEKIAFGTNDMQKKEGENIQSLLKTKSPENHPIKSPTAIKQLRFSSDNSHGSNKYSKTESEAVKENSQSSLKSNNQNYFVKKDNCIKEDSQDSLKTKKQNYFVNKDEYIKEDSQGSFNSYNQQHVVEQDEYREEDSQNSFKNIKPKINIQFDTPKIENINKRNQSFENTFDYMTNLNDTNISCSEDDEIPIKQTNSIDSKQTKNDLNIIDQNEINEKQRTTSLKQIQNNFDDSESSFEEDKLSKLSTENRELFKLITTHINNKIEETKEELHSHLNSIHLDLLYRIRKLNDKVDELKKNKN